MQSCDSNDESNGPAYEDGNKGMTHNGTDAVMGITALRMTSEGCKLSQVLAGAPFRKRENALSMQGVSLVKRLSENLGPSLQLDGLQGISADRRGFNS